MGKNQMNSRRIPCNNTFIGQDKLCEMWDVMMNEWSKKQKIKKTYIEKKTESELVSYDLCE